MRTQYKHMFAAVGLCAALFLLNSCKPIIVKTDKNYIKDDYNFTEITLPEKHIEPFPTASVDYDHVNNMVFFNFENGKQWAVKNDVWDIAIVVGESADSDGNGPIYTVTNSGDYGENTRLLPFEDGKDENHYKGKGMKLSDVQQVCFKKGATDLSPYQNDPDTKTPVANPFYNALTNKKKYFLRVGKNYDAAKLFVIWFDHTASLLPGTSYDLHVKPVILGSNKSITDFGTEYTLSGTIDKNYSFNYIKIYDDRKPTILSESNGIPKKNDWQLLFMRTNIYSKEMGEVFSNDGIIGSSSILTNSPGGVETAALYGWDFPEVTKVPTDQHFERIINGVGKGFANPLKDDPEKRRKSWYYGLNMPPTFYLTRNTYVFKWEAGSTTKYAKFRPGSFYGPHGEKFYVQFRYAVK
ncbi:HmuY family protein [Treponema phagedenis]|uniref:HmuY family protein n=1 Tax=Treponema phagedenis TaxID=162 RepID=UPI0001F6382F|nr:HmuY family protein [Treponema phagedenis]EFW36664.1 hypothetical protein HMPREF9554_02779 [Treponema phagedenis F0421]